MITDQLDKYGMTVEEASQIEEDYHEYSVTFTENRIYQKVVREIEREIFSSFATGDKDEALGAYHEMQGLRRVLNKFQSIEAKYHKLQAIIEDDSNQEY